MFSQYKGSIKWISLNWWNTIIYEYVCYEIRVWYLLWICFEFSKLLIVHGFEHRLYSPSSPACFPFRKQMGLWSDPGKVTTQNSQHARNSTLSDIEENGCYFSLFDFFVISFPEVTFVHLLREEQIFLHSSHMKHHPHSLLVGCRKKFLPKWPCGVQCSLKVHFSKKVFFGNQHIWNSFWAFLLTIMEFPDPLGVCMLCPMLQKSEKHSVHEESFLISVTKKCQKFSWEVILHTFSMYTDLELLSQ